MIRIAVQSKGRLYEDTMNLLKEAGIKVPSSTFEILSDFITKTSSPTEIASTISELNSR